MKTNRKMRPEEISVISAGEQIRRKILGTGRTIEEFSREINLYPVSVKQYLRRNDGGSATFKIKLTQYFNQDYRDIVKDSTQQLSEICRHVSNAIYLYSDEADEAVLLKLKAMMQEHGLEDHLYWMDRNLALNKFCRNQILEALELLGDAYEKAQSHRDLEAVITCATDLALVQYYRSEHESALQWIEEARKRLGDRAKTSDKTTFLVCFRKGVILSKMKAYHMSEECFAEALQHACESTFVGLANLYRAEVLYKMGHVDASKECYRLSLAALDDDPLRQSFVFNSFSEMLLDQGDLQRAKYFSEKAVNCCEKDNILISFQHFETYAKIRVRMGNPDPVYEKLIHMVERASDEFVYRDQILDAVRILIECYESLRPTLAVQLESLIMRLIEKAAADEHNYRKELKSMLAEVILRGRNRETQTS